MTDFADALIRLCSCLPWWLTCNKLKAFWVFCRAAGRRRWGLCASGQSSHSLSKTLLSGAGELLFGLYRSWFFSIAGHIWGASMWRMNKRHLQEEKLYLMAF
jgi:hypothetical protein